MVTALFLELRRRSKSYGDLKRNFDRYQSDDPAVVQAPRQPRRRRRHSICLVDEGAIVASADDDDDHPAIAPRSQCLWQTTGFVSEPVLATLHMSIGHCQEKLTLPSPLAPPPPPPTASPQSPECPANSGTDAASLIASSSMLPALQHAQSMEAEMPPEPPLAPLETNMRIFDLLIGDENAFTHYSQRTHQGKIMNSATVEKLVEIMTRHLDADLMVDFFLTFREFMTPVRLCKLLILRFRWALKDDSDTRRLVRIRTFVVLRYWIGHYWEHDFMVSRSLRFMLCTFLSKVRDHPLMQTSPRDERIIRQLRHLLKVQKKQFHTYPSPLAMDEAAKTEFRASTSSSGHSSKRDTMRSKASSSLFSSKPRPTSGISTNSSVSQSMGSLPRHHGLHDAWQGGLQSIKRSLPAVYQVVLQGWHSIDGSASMTTNCACHALMMPDAPSSPDSQPHRMRKKSFLTGRPARWFASAKDSLSTSSSSSFGSSDEQTAHHPMCSHAHSPSPVQQPPRRRLFTRRMNAHYDKTRCVSYYSDDGPEGSISHHLDRFERSVVSMPAAMAKEHAALAAKAISTPLQDHQSDILMYRSEIIAQQFCMMEQEMLQQVTWHELVELRWRKRSKGTVLSHEAQLQDGVEQLIGFFNKTCQWVASEIVRTRSLAVRARVITKFIRIAIKCHQHRNYSTLMQILLGLQSPSVTRLEQSWRRVDQRELQAFGELKELAKPFRNWKNVREAMTKATHDVDEASALETVLSRAQGTTTMSGCIPFLGLYLSDLVFNAELPTWIDREPVQSQNSTSKHFDMQDQLLHARLQGRMVNYNKFRITASIIKHILAFQVLSRGYQFTRVASLTMALEKMQCLDNDEISKESHFCEP
ncbi:ras guanine nucleotide exchange factor domain-containing protein [Gongronella butleri]|nr:ras guanine nucleotide exchange factor domain-containing protein [Gongronella butleri]